MRKNDGRNSMFFPSDSAKAIQAIGVILGGHHCAMASKLRISKLLYIADRESIQETGRPILGSRVVAMDHGPLHSAVLDLINGEHVDEPRFSENFEKFGYMVQRQKDPGVGRLSRYEIEKLNELCERYASVSDWDLAHNVTHAFEEWKTNYCEGTSRTIPLEAIMDAVGVANRAEIARDIEREQEADALFGEPSK